MGHLNVVVPCFLDPPRIVGDIFRTSLNEQAVNESWTSRERVVNESWTSRERVVNKSWTSRERVVNESWTSREQFNVFFGRPCHTAALQSHQNPHPCSEHHSCEAVRHCAEFHPTAQFHAQMESGIRQLSFRTTQSKLFAIQKQATTMKIPIHKCQSCQVRLEIKDYKILTKLRCKGPLDLLFRWARDVRSSRVKSQKDSTKSVSGSAQQCSTPSPKKWGKTTFATLALSNRV